MRFETIVAAQDAHANLHREDWVFVDCRCFLTEPGRAWREYEESHVRGAIFADLEQDLSGPVVPGVTGRHPLPSPEALTATLGRFGISQGTQVVAYDESTGALAAARLWWLLKWAGHDAVAVLDGGFSTWQALGLPCARGKEEEPSAQFPASFRQSMTRDASQVLAALDDPSYIVLDSRSHERYRGLAETIDPVAGHIRGAGSAPYSENLADHGGFKTPDELAARFGSLIGGAERVIFYCGSGVTASQNVLAFAHAGKGMALLYPGSWSEWITDPARPIATSTP
ncbi:MAG TPA: sulfurtransferase [Spirochaetia bacterium]|nr:sulfurtransferase [Spirochaetia bacterium]